jgi:uncharacterized protein (TIGR02271 family)
MSIESNVSKYASMTSERPMNTALSTAVNAGMSWWDLAFTFQREMQRAALQSFSIYSPSSDTRVTGRLPQQPGGTQVVRLGEERLNVATRTVPGETTRLRRRVIAGPVEQQVTLREEKVIVERRPPTGTTGDVLTETVIEMSDSRQVPTVWKSLHVAEEVVLRKQVTERTEKVRDTVRRDVLEVEHPRQPAAASRDIASSAQNIEARAEIAPPVPHEAPQDKRAQQSPQKHEEPQDKKQGQGLPPPTPPLAVHKS